MSTTMQIAIAANGALHVMAYNFHDQAYEDENYVFHVPIRPYSPEEEQELKEQTVWRLNSRSRGLLELNTQSRTGTFLHRTVVDFLRTQKTTTFLADQASAGFNLMLSLLKIYTSMIKRSYFKEDVVRMKFGEYKNCYLQFLTTGALACAAELEESANPCTETYKVMEELDNTILERSYDLKSLIRGSTPRGSIRENLTRGQHMGYLSWKLPKESCYLSSLGPSLIPCILVPQGAHGRPSRDYAWQIRGIEMLRLVVETQDIDPNEQQFNMDLRRSWSAWTALISHVTSWTRGTNPIAEGQFWDLLENNILFTLLHKGADPNVMIWSSYNECWPAFAAYLDLAFVPSDVTRKALYLQALKDFILAGASMDASQSEFTNRSITQTLGKEMKIVSSSKKFFSRLQNIHTADPMDFNFRVLAEVLDMLLSTVIDSSDAWIMTAIKSVVETAFPPEICAVLKSRYTAILWVYGGERIWRKRKRSLTLDEEPSKRRERHPEGCGPWTGMNYPDQLLSSYLTLEALEVNEVWTFGLENHNIPQSAAF
ncbi:hypothetical protein N7488_009135 [Penicillium malachiteum]|nr:hypothetical protein N7488_009135 [Penicillium malachiteum]